MSLYSRLSLFLLLSLVSACSGGRGPEGPAGTDGDPGTSCTVSNEVDGTRVISCADGTRATVSDGTPGTPGSDGTSCTVADNNDGTRTITCEDGTSVTVADGANGGSCTVADNDDGTRTISCEDGTTVTVSDGADGTSCTVSRALDGSTIVACTDGTFIRVSPPIGSRLDPEDELPGILVTIINVTGASNADGTFAPGDTPTLTFVLTTTSGAAVTLDELSTAEVWIAGPTDNYQHVIPSARDQRTLTDVASTAVSNQDGTYTYTFTTPFPATFGVPLNDTAKFSDGELTGALVPGTYTLTMNVSKTYAIGDELFDDVGSDTRNLLVGGATNIVIHEVVTTQNCNQCHQSLRFHGGLYRDTALCVTCHTAGAEDDNSTDDTDATPVTIELSVMLHKLHNGAHLPSVLGVATRADGTRNYDAPKVPYIVGGNDPEDFSEVGFPVQPSFTSAMPKDTGYSALTASQKTQEDNMRKGVVACEKCHGDPDGAGPLAAPAQGDRFSTALTRRTCGSCHDDVDFARPYTANLREMPAQLTDAACLQCHTAAGSDLSVKDAHLHPQSVEASPASVFHITAVSGGTGPGGNIARGDAPIITFTFQDPDGVDVPVTTLDNLTTLMLGPTKNRQVVLPYATANGVSLQPFDFTGRLQAASTTNKGIMSKVVETGAATSETLVVTFSSSTAFTVSGRTSGALGSGVLGGAPSTNPSGSSIANINLSPTATARALTVSFTSATDFTVLDGATSIGTGRLPANISGSTRFVSNDGSVAFNVIVGTTAFAAGNNIFLAVFKSTGTNPVQFAVVGGRTSFGATDRFYYDFLAPAATYTTRIPMDLPFEPLGSADGSANPVLAAGNTPVLFGRQQVFERTAVVGTATTLSASIGVLGRFLTVAAIDAGLAVGDKVVIDDGTANEEYAEVGLIDPATRRVITKTPMRFAHAAGAALQEATLTFRQEGTAYALDPAAGTITLTAPSTNPFIMSYRTDGRFGWRRKAGDALQATYAPPMNDSPDLDETAGEWAGKSYVDGTYTIALYGTRNFDVGLRGELQTYRAEEDASLADFLFGNATTVEPYSLVSSAQNCQACHTDLAFHGGSRRGPDVCFMCHGVPGAEDSPLYNKATATATPATTVNFRTMLHKIHAGAELTKPYEVQNEFFNQIEYPAMPGGVKTCTKCHGTSEVFIAPTNRNHPTEQGRPVRTFLVTCGSCHDSDSAQAHIEIQTTSSGVESCETCHGVDREYAVERMHKNR